jgi:hypothetical protein
MAPGDSDLSRVPRWQPTEGSKRIGPGLSAAAGRPGPSRAQAAAVQPPGYGLDSPATPASSPPARSGPAGGPPGCRWPGALLVVAVGGRRGALGPGPRTSTRPPCSVVADQLTVAGRRS